MSLLTSTTRGINEGVIASCTLDYCLEFDRWDFSNSNPLSLFFGSIGSSLERPITIRVSKIQAALDHELALTQARLVDDFAHKYPAYSLTDLWGKVQDSNKEIPEIKAMPIECLAAFVNATHWCYAKEGTRQTGRFSIERMWRAAAVNPESIGKFVKPLEYSTECGVCAKEAKAESWSATVKSASRLTTIHCSHCGHVDTVGRKQSSFGENWDFAARLACQCSTCESIRREAVDTAQAQLESALLLEANAIADLTCRELDTIGAPNDSDINSWTKENTFYEKVLNCVAEGKGLKESLLAVASEEWPGLTDENYKLAHVVDKGVTHGWLALSQIRLIEPREELATACLKSIDVWLQSFGKYSLDGLREDVHSGDIHRLINAIKYVTHNYQNVLPPITVDVHLLDQQRKEENLQRKVQEEQQTDLQEKRHAAHSLRKPEREVQSEFISDSRTVAISNTVQLMRRCAAEVDKALGAGTASRCPDLVQEMMAQIRLSE